jgi:hypothetical protein
VCCYRIDRTVSLLSPCVCGVALCAAADVAHLSSDTIVESVLAVLIAYAKKREAEFADCRAWALQSLCFVLFRYPAYIAEQPQIMECIETGELSASVCAHRCVLS